MCSTVFVIFRGLVVVYQDFPCLGLHETYRRLLAFSSKLSHFGPRYEFEVLFPFVVKVIHTFSFPVVGRDFEFKNFQVIQTWRHG